MEQKSTKERGKGKRSTYKTRNWVTVVYPESEKPGWRDILRGWCCQAFVSPLHDKDVDPDGSAKKAHYHVLMMWDGPKAAALMEERVKELGGVGCQPCNSARGYARYLCHLDNPDKAQYDLSAVEAFGGADYLEVIALESDRRATIAEMCDWCRAEGCISFAELCDYARTNRPVWWQALTAHSTMLMFRYIRSLEDEMSKGRYRKPTKSTPEVDSGASPLDVARARVIDAENALIAARENFRTVMDGQKGLTKADS